MRDAVPSERLWARIDYPPNVDAWKDSRAQLAQLVRREDFDVVASYYAPLLALVEACGSLLQRYADRTHWWSRLFGSG